MNKFPAGALVRVSTICSNPKTGEPGLLPISRSGWYKWVKSGRVPPGRKIGLNTTVWPIELIFNLGKTDESW